MAKRSNSAPRLPPRPDSSPVSHLLYYHPHLKDLTDVREVMAPYVLQDGYYLLRNSSKKPDTYTVSVMHDKSIKHFYIFQRDLQFYLQDKYFSTIDNLINHYKHEDVPNMEGIKHIRLLYPILNNRVSFANGACCGSESTESKKSRKVSKFFVSLPGSKKDAGSYCTLQHTMPAAAAPLPPPPPQTDMANISRGHTGSAAMDNTGYVPYAQRKSSSGAIAQRPQAPLPVRHNSDSTASKGLYYSSVNDTEVNQLPALLNMLKVDERARCDCGLFFDEAELPRGWTMHISHDPGTEGRVFFMGPNCQTAWNLPLEVACELSVEQQERIRMYLDTYNKENMRSAAQNQPRAPTTPTAAAAAAPSDLARLVESSPQSDALTNMSESSDATVTNEDTDQAPPTMERSQTVSNVYGPDHDKDDVFM